MGESLPGRRAISPVELLAHGVVVVFKVVVVLLLLTVVVVVVFTDPCCPVFVPETDTELGPSVICKDQRLITLISKSES